MKITLKETFYSSMCEIINWHLCLTKILNSLNLEVQTISCLVEPLVKEEKYLKIMAQSNTIKVSDQVIPAILTKEQYNDTFLGLVYQYVLAGDKLRPVHVATVNPNCMKISLTI